MATAQVSLVFDEDNILPDFVLESTGIPVTSRLFKLYYEDEVDLWVMEF